MGSDGDDIVARLERLAVRAETSKTFVQEFRMMRAEGVADLIHEAMDEIVDLRAQLFNEHKTKTGYSARDVDYVMGKREEK